MPRLNRPFSISILRIFFLILSLDFESSQYSAMKINAGLERMHSVHTKSAKRAFDFHLAGFSRNVWPFSVCGQPRECLWPLHIACACDFAAARHKKPIESIGWDDLTSVLVFCARDF